MNWRDRKSALHFSRKCLSKIQAKRRFWLNKRKFGAGFVVYREAPHLAHQQGRSDEGRGS